MQLWRLGKSRICRAGLQAGDPGKSCSLSSDVVSWQESLSPGALPSRQLDIATAVLLPYRMVHTDETTFPSLTEPKDLVEAKVLTDSEQTSEARALGVGHQGTRHPGNNRTHGSKGDIAPQKPSSEGSCVSGIWTKSAPPRTCYASHLWDHTLCMAL